jgi:hypothetical protein
MKIQDNIDILINHLETKRFLRKLTEDEKTIITITYSIAIDQGLQKNYDLNMEDF